MTIILAAANAAYVTIIGVAMWRLTAAVERLSILASERTPAEQTRLLSAVGAPAVEKKEASPRTPSLPIGM